MAHLLGEHTLLLGAALAQSPSDAWLETGTARGIQMIIGSLVVLALLGIWAWLMRRGVLTRRTNGAITIETAVPLGERRSLVIVTVEGRRLLLGLTPASVSLVTSLESRPADFTHALDQAGGETAEVT